MNKLIPLLLVAALIASPFAFAAHDGSSGEHCDMHKKQGMMKDADKNNDGNIDKAEARAMHDQHFDEADSNKDGKLSADEIRNCKHEHGAMHDKGTMGFTSADKNADSKLDRTEAAALPNVGKNFDAIDANKDGLLERDEVHSYMKSRHQP
jgi:Ca2+-binding EF-hand superfamily protein